LYHDLTAFAKIPSIQNNKRRFTTAPASKLLNAVHISRSVSFGILQRRPTSGKTVEAPQYPTAGNAAAAAA